MQNKLEGEFVFQEGPPSTSSISRALTARGFHRRVIHAVKDSWNFPRTMAHRLRYLEEMSRTVTALERFVFMDEESWNFASHRTIGRAKPGYRAIQMIPGQQGISHSLVLAICAGTNQPAAIHHQLWTGGTTGDRLVTFFETLFAKMGVNKKHRPSSKVHSDAPYIFLDNAKPHHSKVRVYVSYALPLLCKCACRFRGCRC